MPSRKKAAVRRLAPKSATRFSEKAKRKQREPAAPVSQAEAARLFAPLKALSSVVLAVSGGPDSVALMWLAARWRSRLVRGPELVAVTVDHGVRKESAREARSVKALARTLGVEHKTLRWRGAKPASGIPAAAREMRYRLMAQAARANQALHIVTAHTRDDQAETLMMRMARGSGLAGLAAMTGAMQREDGIIILRPLLDVPKQRLVATLSRAGIEFADDPTNRDASFTRPRWRALMPALAEEGLDARALARLASRLGRANAAVDHVVAIMERTIARAGDRGAIEIDARAYATLPDEIALRLLGRAIASSGHEGPVELAKLEALFERLRAFDADRPSASRQARLDQARLKQTLAGAVVTATADLVLVAPAPPRRKQA